jgi:hypothetical protein
VGVNGVGAGDGAEVAPALPQDQVDARERLDPAAEP